SCGREDRLFSLDAPLLGCRAGGLALRSRASPACHIPLLREAGRSSSKYSNAHTLRVLQRLRTTSGSAPHGRDHRPPCLAAPVGAFPRIYTIAGPQGLYVTNGRSRAIAAVQRPDFS